MHESPQLLADRLREEADRVFDFFIHLTDEQWGLIIYPLSSDWTLHDLLAHFVSSEIGRKELIIDVINGGIGAPQNFDIDAYNQQEVGKLSGNSHKYLLESFTRERAGLVKLVSALDSSDLERRGNDPYLGETSLGDMIKLTYRHPQIHLREVRRSI